VDVGNGTRRVKISLH